MATLILSQMKEARGGHCAPLRSQEREARKTKAAEEKRFLTTRHSLLLIPKRPVAEFEKGFESFLRQCAHQFLFLLNL